MARFSSDYPSFERGIRSRPPDDGNGLGGGRPERCSPGEEIQAACNTYVRRKSRVKRIVIRLCLLSLVCVKRESAAK